MSKNSIILLKTLVGSHSHGLATETSDYDYRGVYIVPTSEILSLDYKPEKTNWIEGDVDNTSYELGHFLMLATKCNPSILEVMVAPVVESHDTWGTELRGLLPYCWDPQQAFNAFTGYSVSQRKKMLDDHLGRWQKYAIAYLRTLVNLITLLSTGTFNLKIENDHLLDSITWIKKNRVGSGYVIDDAIMYEHIAKTALSNCIHKPDYSKVNDFLLNARKHFWGNTHV